MKTQYSRPKKYNGRTYRFNYTEALLEWVHEGEVVTAIGLSAEDWKEGPQHWVEQYDMELEEELYYLIKGEYEDGI